MKIAGVAENGRVTRRSAPQSTRSVRLQRNFVLASVSTDVAQYSAVAAQPRIQSHSVDLPAALSFFNLFEPPACCSSHFSHGGCSARRNPTVTLRRRTPPRDLTSQKDEK